MMSKKQSAIFTYGIMNTVMCVCMAATALIVNVGLANIVVPMYLVTLVQALVICNLCTLIFRIPGLSFRAAMALSGGKPGSPAFTVWNGLFNATLNTVFMNTFMTLINVGFTPAYFPAWIHGFPALEVVAVVVSFVIAPIGMRIVTGGKKPGPDAE